MERMNKIGEKEVLKTMKNRIIVCVVILLLLSVMAGIVGTLLFVRKSGIEANESPTPTQTRDAATDMQIVGEEIYKNLVSAIQQSGFAGIVCWGDESIAKGALPDMLESEINNRLFDEVRSELFKKADVLNARGLKIQVVNMGAEQEGFHEILTRTGAEQLTLGEDFIIPEGRNRTNITLADPNGATMLFSVQRYAKFGETMIGGVAGRLYDGDGYYDEEHKKLAFVRDKKGSEVTVPKGTPIYTEGARNYRDCIPVLFFAETEDISVEEFKAGIEAVLAIYGNGTYVLICTTQDRSEWDRELTDTFGDRYIRNDKNIEEARGEDDQRLAELIYANLKDQGLFDGMIEAVGRARRKLDAE